MKKGTAADQTLARYQKFGWEYHLTQGAGSQHGDLEWFCRVAQENGGPVLDLGCGSGRLLRPLRELNLAVVGVDGSRPLLSLFGGEPRVALVQGRFERLCFCRHSFGTVIVAGNTLPLIAEDVRRRLFVEIRGVLRPGGVLAVNLRRHDLAKFEGGVSVVYRQEPLYDEARGCWTTRCTELRYNPESRQIVTRFVFQSRFPGEETEVNEYETVACPDYADCLTDEAGKAGFVVETVSAGYGREDCSGSAVEMMGIVLRAETAP